MLRIQAMYFDSIRCYASYASYCVTINTGVFLGKCVRTAAKTMVLDRKNQKALALLGLALGPLPNAVNSSAVSTELAAEPTGNKDEVVEGKFSNLNFLPSTKKTTEYSFELLFSIYRYLIYFFLKF